MTVFNPPVDAVRFALVHGAGFNALCGLLDNEDISPEIIGPILEGTAATVRDAWQNLNEYGDKNPPHIENGGVVMPDGFKKAYEEYRNLGQGCLPFSPVYGGHGLPHVISFAAAEMIQGASAAFGLCPMLTQSVAVALDEHASDEIKKTYLPNLVSGRWTGTMNLTEADAGSDLSAVSTAAVRVSDGSYRITGQKIFITFGDHDMAENIIGLVLARISGAPQGAKGLSLFAVPKFNVNADGSIGNRNNVSCLSLEHKTGIKGSPTCVMRYDGAVGYLVGEENRGLEYSFTMMKYARLSVGIQSVAVMERAFRASCGYAAERIQGRLPGNGNDKKIAIAGHPDVRRMLLTMQTATEAARCLTYYAVSCIDLQQSSEEKIVQKSKSRADLLIPAVKAWCSDLAEEVTSLAIRVHGGAGYIAETGIEQLWRDARVFSIYEGTNGIQASELVFRRVLADKGQAVRTFIKEMTAYCEEHLEDMSPPVVSFMTQFQESLKRLEEATVWISEKGANDLEAVACGAYPYLKMFSAVSAAFVYSRAAFRLQDQNDIAGIDSDELFERVRFFGETFLPSAIAMLPTIKLSHGSIMKARFEKEK